LARPGAKTTGNRKVLGIAWCNASGDFFAVLVEQHHDVEAVSMKTHLAGFLVSAVTEILGVLDDLELVHSVKAL